MRRIFLGLIALCTLVGPLSAGGKGKVILDEWETAYLQGRRSGFLHRTVTRLTKDKRLLFHVSERLVLNVQRFGTPKRLDMEIGDIETKEGKVLLVFMRHFLGKKKQFEIRGKVSGDKLVFDGDRKLNPVPWNNKAVGIYRQLSLCQVHKIKPASKFTYLSFEPSVNYPIQMHVHAKRFEGVNLPGKPGAGKYLRVEIKPQRIQGVQLPTKISWLDKSYKPVRSESLVPGMGLLTLYRANKKQATRPVVMSQLPDLGFSQLIAVKQRIDSPYTVKKAVYRITVKGEEKAAGAVAASLRQKIKNAKKDKLELHVQAGPAEKSEKPGDEFLQSSYFINWKNSRVKDLAAKAVGAEKEAWKQALKIENWVNRNMRVVNHEAMATADHVAQTLQGDCSEFAMLMAAMCRAKGIPARTAIGLIYANTRRGPAFAYHMWTEVWINGRWVALDATLGKGFVGATHIKINDHSWHQTKSLTPMLPLLRVLGKLSIEVVRLERE